MKTKKQRVMGYVVNVKAVIPLAGGDADAWANAVKTANNMKNVLEEAGAKFHTIEEYAGDLNVETGGEPKANPDEPPLPMDEPEKAARPSKAA